MRTNRRQLAEALTRIEERLATLEQQAELMKTVMIVKEPDAVHSADAYEGLRKQVIASSTARRAHLVQLTQMAVATARATKVSDLTPQIDEWLEQAGVTRIAEVPAGVRPFEVFEDIDGGSLPEGEALEILEPAYYDTQTQVLLRLGRARRKPPAVQPEPVDELLREDVSAAAPETDTELDRAAQTEDATEVDRDRPSAELENVIEQTTSEAEVGR
jgi:hypothetical protein